MMPQKGRKVGCQNVDPLRLDNLPENAIDAILMHLPLRDAVRTSILSKKWRYNWCRLPELTLDQTLFDETDQSIDPTTKFTKIVYHFLTLHLGPITKFSLSIPDLVNCPNIDNLICFLSRNGIQRFFLQLPKDGDPYRLPSSFFTCLQMRYLTLHNCAIHPPQNFIGFDRLINLELCEVTLSSKLLESLISHCPLLEELVLQTSSYSPHRIKINAPKLKYFEFKGIITRICLKNCPLLVEISLEDPRPYWDTLLDDGKFFESIFAVEQLHLNYIYAEFLVAGAGAGKAPPRLPYALNCLTHLSLEDICVGDFVEASCALCLLRSSPYLQHFEFKVYPTASVEREINSLEALQVEFLDVTLNHLRFVRLMGITGTKPEMELIKLLLAKSPVLVRMLIQPGLVDDSPEATVRILTELTKFPRASTKAEVAYERIT